jgi:UDP-GlcNAc:undecaprenyl-phosphate GlcNAc-1-phosphate transferase
VTPAERAFVAVAAGLAATWVTMLVAGRVGLLDHPGPRKPHARPVPLAGGVGIAVAVTLAVQGAVEGPSLLLGVWALVVLGLLDDTRDLRARTRLLAQAAAVLPAVLAYTPSVGAPRAVEVSLALLWVLGAISALNCIDCADGVAASVAVAGGTTVAALAGWSGSAGAIGVSVAGAAAGFLVLNAPPARCFLGEGGSTVLGYLLAIAGLVAASGAPRTSALTVAVAGATVLALPVLDFVLVHARRAREGVRNLAQLMASAGTDHLPHRLRSAGLSPWSVAVACGCATAICGLAANASSRAGLASALAIGLALSSAFLGADRVLGRARSSRERAWTGPVAKEGRQWS